MEDELFQAVKSVNVDDHSKVAREPSTINIVAKFSIHCKVNLVDLALKVRNCSYEPK